MNRLNLHQLALVTNGINNPALGGLNQNSGPQFVGKLVPDLLTILLVVGSLFFMFMILFSAIQWITSGGDKQAVEAARGRLTQALIGVAIMFAVFAIVKLIETFFGVQILNIDLGNYRI